MTYITPNLTFTPADKAQVNCLVVLEGFSDKREALTSKEVVPWGTYRIEQRGGRGFREIEGLAYFENQGSLNAMFGYVGEAGSLYCDWMGGTVLTAVLEYVDQEGEYLAGSVVAAKIAFTGSGD